MQFEILISFCIATSLLAITPGPDNIYVLMQSIVNGRKYGIATVLGLMTGCIIHTSVVAFGASTILKQNPRLFFIIKLFGALYLVYLAYKVYASSGNIELGSDAIPKKSVWQLFKQGFIMNVLNPKVTLFFLALFPGFLFSETMNEVIQFYILGLLFMLVSFIIFSGIAVLAGIISDTIKKHKNIGIYLKWTQIIVFIGIAVFIMIN
ncbi:Homoserine/homoserine lactone efflux protein [Kordia antarctica]|uniref:Homoserine/homoserine lactone efflux protein n=1 Tax=Kordia antarctica TaxID=1218801 RepID=A0A7L4ZFZ5_9FLAO|nr:LysE family translocator [Kordia antarctica]QHI35535.1 Homoserine/homoserine lactone efflux protein [Kordia antarctica]